MAEPTSPKPRRAYTYLMVIIVVAVIAAMLLGTKHYLLEKYRPLVIQYVAATLTHEEKRALVEQAGQQTASLWDTVPEPLVGRLAKPNLTVQQSYAEVKTNNAGMRASKPFAPKAANTYRVVCLGDSFVMGEAGKEEDRWCDQMQQWFDRSGTKIDNKPVEMLAVGLSSWNALQEATYLTSRLSDYDPDLIIVLTVSNDITHDYGVTGSGNVTNDFSTSQRQWGNGVFMLNAGTEFGSIQNTALVYDNIPLAQELWHTAMNAFKRLAELQQQRHGKILFSVLNEDGRKVNYFENAYRQQFIQAVISAPMTTVTYQRSTETMLPHDSHPNQKGHALLASQYLHALQQLGLLSNDANLPALEPVLQPVINPPLDDKLYLQQRQNTEKRFAEQLDFAAMNDATIHALIGGILPERSEPRRYPWMTVRSGFVVRRPEPAKNKLVIEVDVPGRVELFPLAVQIRLHNKVEQIFRVVSPGKQTFVIPTGSALQGVPVVEVLLTADHYFTQIDDHRMKVCRLLSAHWD